MKGTLCRDYLRVLDPGGGEVVHHAHPVPDPVARPAVDEAVQGGLHFPPPLLQEEAQRDLAHSG